MKYVYRVLALAVSLTLVAPVLPTVAQQAQGPVTQPAPVERRLKQMNDLLAEQWEYALRTNPEFASILGDRRYNDKLDDYSQAAVERDIEQTQVFLRKFESIDPAGFAEQDRLNHELMVSDLREELEGVKFKRWQMPVTQFSGIHINLPQLVTSLPFSTVKDYDDYIARLQQVPVAMDQVTDRMRTGLQSGLMPPRILLVQVVEQVQNIAHQKPEETPFAQPTLKFPADIPEAEQKRLRTGVTAAIRDRVLPAYARFLTFVRDEYAPRGRTDIGLWALPDGGERYAYAIRRLTTTRMDPERIHKLGLDEVARIETEQLAIVKRLGFADLKRFNASLKETPQLHPKSREQIIESYRHFTDQMQAQLPRLFGRLPRARLVISPVEPYREKQASGAQYNQGTPDGSRPGHVFVNTYDYANQLTITNESTAYHEGVPGHHMQIAIAQELPELPPFRQQAGYTAYVEGWALYSEGLGKEVGFYKDPYSDYGRLEDEKWRAIRLVVDTGIHHKRWTRDMVVQYMRDHSSSNEANIQSETDRYISWPAQALAYKLGQLTIRRLRERASQQLGPAFDIRAFHDTVLGAGALPLDVLERRLDTWVVSLKPGAKGAKTSRTEP